MRLPVSLGFAVALTFLHLSATAQEVNLGTANNYAVLACSTITSTGATVINGGLGVAPGNAVTGRPIVNGLFDVDDASAVLAQNDLTTAYNDAAGRTPTPSGPFLNPGVGNIGGLNLIPGLYKFTGTASITGSDVTLTGGPDDVWIFQIAADLEVGSRIQVFLAGGAQAGNIFWQVGTSATIGTFAVFKGTIMSDQAIVMNTSSAMDGRALAFTAGVTFNGSVGDLPTPNVPEFIDIPRKTTNSVTIVLSTPPLVLATLQSSPGLSPANWTTIATNTPVTSPWTVTDTNVMATVTQRFYRAFITPN